MFAIVGGKAKVAVIIIDRGGLSGSERNLFIESVTNPKKIPELVIHTLAEVATFLRRLFRAASMSTYHEDEA